MNSVPRFWILRTLAILVFASGGFCLFVALLNGWAWFDPTLKFSIYAFGPLSVNLNTLVGGRGKVPEAAFQVLSYAATVILFFIGRWLWRLAGEPKADQPPSPEAMDRSRKELMGVVRNVWIDNRLRNSIHNSVPMHPDKALSQEPVDYKLDLTVRSANEQEHLLSDNERLIDVYDRASGRLLILGAPGAGKTTTLLQLTEQLLDRANDASEPFPVVFTLGYWTEQEFGQWLVGQFRARYDIDKNTARCWLDERKVVLILDGLDEVQPEAHQETCLLALNKFRAESHLKVVLTSRIKDYELLDTKMDAELALEVKPLSPEKIDNYLDGLGSDGELLRSAFANEPELKMLAATPFLLNVMAISAPDLKLGLESQRQGNLTERVLDSFIRNRLRLRKSRKIPHSPTNIARFLKLLARNMRRETFGGAMLLEFTSILRSEPPQLSRRVAIALVGKYGKWSFLAYVLFILAGLLWLIGRPLTSYFSSHTLDMATKELSAWRDSALPSLVQALPNNIMPLLFLVVTTASVALLYTYAMRRKKRILQRAGLAEVTAAAERSFTLQIASVIAIVTVIIMFVTIFWPWVSPIQASGTSLKLFESPIANIAFMALIGIFLLVFLTYSFPLELVARRLWPLDTRGFLRDCVKLKLMYRAGPGYVFIHRLLLDHFAELDIDRLHLEDLEKPRT